MADERTAKAAELEQKVALLEVCNGLFSCVFLMKVSIPGVKVCVIITMCHQVECASLNQELQDSEARARRGQKKSPEEANQMIQVCVIKSMVDLHFHELRH